MRRKHGCQQKQNCQGQDRQNDCKDCQSNCEKDNLAPEINHSIPDANDGRLAHDGFALGGTKGLHQISDEKGDYGTSRGKDRYQSQSNQNPIGNGIQGSGGC